MSATQTISVKVTPTFRANYDAYHAAQYRVICNQGSTRSSKTYSIVQLLISIASSERKSISVVSPSLPHLKRGARRDFIELMQDMGLYADAAFNKTDNLYSFDSGSYIEFFGVEDEQKVRGPGRDILFVNEANLLTFATYKQLALRTNQTIFLDFNPADENSWVYDVADNTKNKLIISTYRNNLANLSSEQVNEIESLKDADENLWNVYGLGLRGTSSETIYTHWKRCVDVTNHGDRIYGLDFGYNVPSALIEVAIYDGRLFAKQLLYESKLTTADLIARLKEFQIPAHAPIYADAAEPKTIEEIYRSGYNIKPAIKDVREGIRKLKSLPLNITSDSVDLIKEISSYKWKIDRNGNVLDEPVKAFDHAVDALRYAVFSHFSVPVSEWFAL